MSNQFSPDGVAPEAAPPPSTDTAAAANEAGLRLVAEASDSAEDYVKERRDQQAIENGEELSSSRQHDRLDRYRRALNAASEREPEKYAPSPPVGETYHDDWESNIREQTRREASFAVRAETYFEKNPEAKADIETALTFYPLAPEVEAQIVNSKLGPRVLHEIAKVPDVANELNALPPAEIARVIGHVEGRLLAEDRLRQESWQQPNSRQRTNAPRPIKPLTGGASASFDPNNTDMGSYEKWRRNQEKD